MFGRLRWSGALLKVHVPALSSRHHGYERLAHAELTSAQVALL